MSEERKRILSMLAEGKISTDEAEELLRALTVDKDKNVTARKDAKFLRVRVIEAGGKTKVNVNVPLSLAKIALKFIPDDAKEQMASKSIDLDEIIKEIQNGAPAGKIVEVDDGQDRVEVYID